MTRTFRILGLSMLLVLSPLAAWACGDGEPSQEEAVATLCDDLDELRSSLADLLELGPDTTVGELQDVRENVEEDVDVVVEDAGDVAEASADALATASDDLRDAVNSIDEDTTLADAASQLLDDVTAVVNEQQELYESLNCSEDGGTPAETPAE